MNFHFNIFLKNKIIDPGKNVMSLTHIKWFQNSFWKLKVTLNMNFIEEEEEEEKKSKQMMVLFLTSHFTFLLLILL